MKRSYKIAVDCAACANKMEAAASKIAGVKSVTVNFLLQKMAVEFADDCDPQAVMQDVLRTCRRIEPEFEIDD